MQNHTSRVVGSNWVITVGAVLLLAVTACGGDGGGGGGGVVDASSADGRTFDGGPAIDSGTDAAQDGGVDGGSDASPVDAGIDAMPVLVEFCANSEDDDGDTFVDCDDPDCDVSLECNLTLLVCPEGQTRSIVRASDLPRLIAGGQTTVSNLVVGGAGQITDIAVQVSLLHGFVGDLDLVLVGPANQRIVLSEGNGGSGNGYAATVFHDDAAQTISSGDAPFAGTFQPDEPLRPLLFTDAAGTWHFEAIETVDDNNPEFDNGALTDVAVGLCLCENCELGPQCLDTIDNDTDTLTDCQDPDCASEPLCALDLLCGPGETRVILTPSLPVAIPDDSQITRVVNNATAGTVTNVAIRFSATHAFSSDLFIIVQSPGGSGGSVQPVVDVGGSSSLGFTDTVLVDSAEISIADAEPPFTGVFRPLVPFSTLDGKAAGGDWTLTFGDNAGDDTGSITEFDLLICVQP